VRLDDLLPANQAARLAATDVRATFSVTWRPVEAR
jgi:hypothetical protein